MNNESINNEGSPETLEPIGKIIHDFICGLKTGTEYSVHFDDLGEFVERLLSQGFREFTLDIDATGEQTHEKGLVRVKILSLV